MNANSQPDAKELKSGKMSLLLIFLTVFIDLIGFGIVIPVMPTFAEKLHASSMTVGFLIASYSLMQFLFMPFWGRLSDRVGRRPILLVSLVASCLGYLIWGFSGSLAMLFLSRIVAGAGNANLAVAQAYVSDVTTTETRAKGMGIVGAAFGLGFVLGPAIGGLCVGHGLATVGFVAAGFSVLDLVLTFFFLPEPPKRSLAGTERFSLDPSFYWHTLLDKKLSVSLAIFLISTFAFANMEATIVLLTNAKFAFTPPQNSMMFVYIGLLICFIQGGMIHRLSKKYGEKKLIAVGTFLIAVGLLLTAAAQNTVMLYGALFFLAMGSGINTPSNQSLLSKLAPTDHVGGVMGVGQSLSTLGRIIGPAVGGAAFQYLGMASPYFIGAAAMLLAFALSFKLKAPQINGAAKGQEVAVKA